jgi:hypothetical protein
MTTQAHSRKRLNKVAKDVVASTASATNSTFHLWNLLPIDMKLRVLDYPLRLTRAIQYQTHSHHVYRALLPFSLVSKNMRAAALRVYYGNGVLLERNNKETVIRSKMDSKFDRLAHYRLFKHPKPAVGAFVSKVELRINVNDRFDLEPMVEEKRNREDIVNEWFILLRPKSGRASNKRRSEWQHALPNIASVHVILNFHHGTFVKGDNYVVEPARCLELCKTNMAIGYHEVNEQVEEVEVREPRKVIQEMLAGVEVLFNPYFIQTTVSGFACQGHGRDKVVECPHGCPGNIVKAMKEFFQARHGREANVSAER